MLKRIPGTFESIAFVRPRSGPVFADPRLDLPLSGLTAWQSNGGPGRGHPAKSLPFTLDVPLGGKSSLRRIHFLGVLALFAGPSLEVPGTLGASVQLLKEGSICLRQELFNGRHYSDATDLAPLHEAFGDGFSLETVGDTDSFGQKTRVDLLSLDVPEDLDVDLVRFKTLASPASFVIFDIFADFSRSHACPFHSRGGGVALADVGAIVRLRDRTKFDTALGQLESALSGAEDVEDARGMALAFLAVVTASMLEMGGSQALLRKQLDAARSLDRAPTSADVAAVAKSYAALVTASLFGEHNHPSAQVIDHALSFVDRNFARDLTDASVARECGLSTSHFRFLFRKVTGQPFHQYLVALRLEKARRLLLQSGDSIGVVSRATGFARLSHFSRSFTERFGINPSDLKRSAL